MILGVLAVLRKIEEDDPSPAVLKAAEAAEQAAAVEMADVARRARRPAWAARPVVTDVDPDDAVDGWREGDRPAEGRPDAEPVTAGAGRP